MEEIKVKLENFEGPLDLLIHLIEEEKIEVHEINISNIIDEYIIYIKKAQKINLEIKTEFLIMASELLEIKALSVLNKKRKQEKEKELEDRILEYKKYKELSEKIKDLECEYNIYHTRYGEKSINKISNNELDLSRLTINKLFEVYKSLMEEKTEEKLVIELNEGNFSIEEGINEIKASFEKEKKISFSKLLQNNYSKIKIVCMFLAILELYKINYIDFQQDEEEILIEHMR